MECTDDGGDPRGDLLWVLRTALRAPGHGCKVRAVSAACVGCLSDHDHREGDACLYGPFRDKLEVGAAVQPSPQLESTPGFKV